MILRDVRRMRDGPPCGTTVLLRLYRRLTVVVVRRVAPLLHLHRIRRRRRRNLPSTNRSVRTGRGRQPLLTVHRVIVVVVDISVIGTIR